jgi:hypothetical protein
VVSLEARVGPAENPRLLSPDRNRLTVSERVSEFALQSPPLFVTDAHAHTHTHIRAHTRPPLVLRRAFESQFGRHDRTNPSSDQLTATDSTLTLGRQARRPPCRHWGPPAPTATPSTSPKEVFDATPGFLLRTRHNRINSLRDLIMRRRTSLRHTPHSSHHRPPITTSSSTSLRSMATFLMGHPGHLTAMFTKRWG